MTIDWKIHILLNLGFTIFGDRGRLGWDRYFRRVAAFGIYKSPAHRVNGITSAKLKDHLASEEKNILGI